MKKYFPKIGICLTGGGAAGAYQAGMLNAFRSLFIGNYIKAVSTVSVGALNGSLALSGKFDTMKELWFSLKRKDLCKRKFFGCLPWTASVYDTTPLWNLIVKEVNPAKIIASGMDFYVQCTNRDTGKGEIFTGMSPHLKQAVYASTAIPILFPQVDIGGTYYIDGGLIDNDPLSCLLYSGNGKDAGDMSAHCDVIFVLHCHSNKKTNPKREVLSKTRLGMKTLQSLYAAAQFQDRYLIKLNNELSDRDMTKLPKCELIDVYPEQDNIGLLEFDRDKFFDAYTHGLVIGTKEVSRFKQLFDIV